MSGNMDRDQDEHEEVICQLMLYQRPRRVPTRRRRRVEGCCVLSRVSLESVSTPSLLLNAPQSEARALIVAIVESILLGTSSSLLFCHLSK